MSWMSPLTVPITILPRRGAPVAIEQRAQDGHAGLHRIGGEQHFRHEQDAVAEIDADDAHALDQTFGQGLVGGPAALEQDMDALFDLFLEAVIEVVVNLLGQFLVVQGPEVEFAFITHRLISRDCGRF